MQPAHQNACPAQPERAARLMLPINKFNWSPTFFIVLGLSFALLPTIGPFVAVLLLIGQTFIFRRSDTIWVLAAIASSIPLGLQHGLSGLLAGIGPVFAAWLVYRAFNQLPRAQPDNRFRYWSVGLLLGLSFTVVTGWLQNANFSFAYRTVAQAITWETNPALYGHTMLALGCAIALLIPFVTPRILALAVAAFGILVSGSREAGLAWLLFTLALPALDTTMREKRDLVRYYGMVTILLVALAGLGGLLGWGRTGFLVDVVALPSSETNLVQSSEFPESDYWFSHGVTVDSGSVTINETVMNLYRVSKIDTDPWVRLQQVIDIESGQPFTASVWIRRGESDIRPGIQAWAELADGSTFSVVGTRNLEAWSTSASGQSKILASGIDDADGEWRRYWFSFVYEGGQSPVQLFIGLAPDNRPIAGTTTEFAGFQMELGTEPTEYVPGSATRGVSLGAGRLPFWAAAWQGFTESPWIGNSEPFPDYYLSLGRQRDRIQEPPAHAHNQVLHSLYTSGIMGLIGLSMLVLAFTWPTYNRRDYPALLLIGAILLVNVFDTTLLYGGVLYPLAAVLGWRATMLDHQSEREKLRTARFLNNTSLALAAFAAPWLAGWLLALVLLATAVLDGSAFARPVFLTHSAFLYTCFLWPVFAWTQGLFPGYGLSAPQQLKRQVTSSLLAGLVFALVVIQFIDDTQISITHILFIAMVGTLLLPVLMAVAKRILLASGIWGEDVVILGAGQGGQRVTSALVNKPLTGFRPVALFDDDPDKRSISVQGVSVAGPLGEAVDFAHTHHVDHAIIAIPTMRAELVGRFMDVTGRRFRRVQFIPDLPGMPAEDVTASNIDGLVALEVNNGLFSIANQLAKRTIDVLCSLIAGLILVIPLGIIYLIIRLDSPGEGFHRGERIGKDGKAFKCLKFRTMYLDAEEKLKEILRQDAALRSEYERFHKLENDPRITRIGGFLRKYSLDELPQLYNVLVGEMSLVGARPYLVRELPAMGEHAQIILQAKPGITGLWQVSGRNELSFQERLDLESHYVRNWTIWWDIIIMAQTVEALISRRGAK